jgi:hypothetical protein
VRDLDGLAGLAAREAMDPAEYLAQCPAVHPITRDRCAQVRHPKGTKHWHEWSNFTGTGYTWEDGS